ncbi:MAG: recombinase family protein [Planctomycetes bacterium]|nr:recombinase family protein [Planctomycetota bacterium]
MKAPQIRPAGPTVAYSYIRFSSAAQADGDSLRRQTERAQAYCQRRGWMLDQTLSLRDLGVSAFKGKNAAVGNFRTFLDAVKEGKVAPGSVLVVESFDRISRQGIDEGYDLIKSILKADVKIVTLSPEREFDREATRGLSKGALEIQLILERAAEESERKSDRVGQAWAAKRKDAAENKTVISRSCPAWIRVEGKGDAAKYVLIPARAEVVRRVFRLATDGHGARAVLKRLVADKVSPFGNAWNVSYIKLLLKSRQTFGEFTPRERGKGGTSLQRKAVGPAIPNYYPAAIDQDTFFAAQAATATRTGKAGRPAKEFTNVFSGIIWDARTLGRLHLMQYRRDGVRTRYLAPYAATNRGARHVGFSLDALESALFNFLVGIDPRAIMLTAERPATDSAAIEAKVKDIDAQLARLKARVKVEEEVGVIIDAVHELEEERKDESEKLAEAQRREAAPTADAWGEFKTIAAALAAAPDKDAARVKLRAVLRRMLAGVWCLFLPEATGPRVAHVQVVFAGGEKFQHFTLVYRPRVGTRAGGEYPGAFVVRELVTTAPAGDIRVEKNARALEAALAGVEPSVWEEIVPGNDQRAIRSKAAGKRRDASKERAVKWRKMRDKGMSYAAIATMEQPPVSTNTVHYMLNGRKRR